MSIAVTARTIRTMRSFGAARRRRVPRQASFSPIIRDYTRQLLALTQQTKSVLAPLLAEMPYLLASARSLRAIPTNDNAGLRRDAGESDRAKELLKRARESLTGATQPQALERIAAQFADQTSQFNKTQLARQTKAALGVDVFATDPHLREKMQGFVNENVSLITSIPEELLTDVEGVVFRGLARGVTAKQLAEEIDEQFEVGARRAAAIARDQIGTFYGQLNAERQQAIGLTRFIWRNQHDERVRPEHREREEASDPALGGTPYSYEDPPDGELPGEPHGCRCYGEGYYADILDAV